LRKPFQSNDIFSSSITSVYHSTAIAMAHKILSASVYIWVLNAARVSAMHSSRLAQAAQFELEDSDMTAPTSLSMLQVLSNLTSPGRQLEHVTVAAKCKGIACDIMPVLRPKDNLMSSTFADPGGNLISSWFSDPARSRVEAGTLVVILRSVLLCFMIFLLVLSTTLKPCASTDDFKRQEAAANLNEKYVRTARSSVPFWPPEAPMISSPQPLDMKKRVQLSVRIEEPSSRVLETPITKRRCVFYSADVSQLEDQRTGRSVGLAAAEQGIDFEVSLIDMPNVKVLVRGSDVRLMHFEEGRCALTSSFEDAPHHWQAFAVEQRNGEACEQPMADGKLLNFQENALLIGARVTIDGQLHCTRDGRLVVLPCDDTDEEDPTQKATQRAKAGWRSSWEALGFTNEKEDKLPSKVLISGTCKLEQASTPEPKRKQRR